MTNSTKRGRSRHNWLESWNFLRSQTMTYPTVTEKYYSYRVIAKRVMKMQNIKLTANYKKWGKKGTWRAFSKTSKHNQFYKFITKLTKRYWGTHNWLERWNFSQVPNNDISKNNRKILFLQCYLQTNNENAKPKTNSKCKT